MKLWATTVLLTWLLVVAPSAAQAIIVLRDPGRNTAAPTGALRDCGWQYEGDWHGFTGTAIGPTSFISAAHVGGYPGAPFVFHGTTYRAIDATVIVGTDLCVWRISGRMPFWAPLYTGRNEVGREVVLCGRGSDRGAEVRPHGVLLGWRWGRADTRLSWGRSWIDQDSDMPPPDPGMPTVGETFLAPFDADMGADAGCVSGGDSGGGVFFKDADGIWKLVGVIYGVEIAYSESKHPADRLSAALFDVRGLCRIFPGGKTSLVGKDSPEAVPVHSIVSRIAPSVDEIQGAAVSNARMKGLLSYLAETVGPPILVVVVLFGIAGTRYGRRRPTHAGTPINAEDTAP